MRFIQAAINDFWNGECMMKIGFSTVACPSWGLTRILDQAGALGYQGVEFRGLEGELHLPLAPTLAGNPDGVRKMFAERKLELVCLGTSASLTSRDKDEVARQKGIILEFVELASRLGCPFVRLHAGEVQKRDTSNKAFHRFVEGIKPVADAAAQQGVSLLVENGGDFRDSWSMWQLCDTVSHPAVRICWNQVSAMSVPEQASISVPRLGTKMALVHVGDARFDERGVLQEHVPLGEGDVNVAKQIELLKGINYQGYLVFEWPKLWVDALAGPDIALPKAAEFLKAALAAKQPILSAYKGDKNAPKFATAPVPAVP
jgi:sugar phosphate isomerase/epimerase